MLELLLATHFLNSEFTKDMVVPAAVHHAKCFDWRVAVSVITYGERNGQSILLSHTNIQKWMTYSWPCCKRDR